MSFAISHCRRCNRASAPQSGASGAGLFLLGIIATTGSVARHAQSEHHTRNEFSLGFMTSTWSLDARSRKSAPDWSTSAIAQYRTPQWRFRLTAPYYFGTAPNGRDLGGLGRLSIGADYYSRLDSRTVLTPYARALIDTGAMPRRITGGSAGELGIGATHTFDRQWSATARVGYRFQERTSARSRSSFPTWELAAGYRPSSRDAFQLAIVNQPTRFDGLPDARYLSLAWSHSFRPGLSLQFYTTAGLTPTSPDYGVGVGGMFRLD
jgi:hypothetical protein